MPLKLMIMGVCLGIILAIILPLSACDRSRPTAPAAPEKDSLSCPEGMALIPAGEVDTVWKVGPDHPWAHGRVFERVEDAAERPARKIAAFCLDLYEYSSDPLMVPRFFVGFAEAQKLCLEQGKHLCTEDQWELACAGPQKNAYAYGPQLERGRCNTDEDERMGQPEMIKSGIKFPRCQNPQGVFNLNGNVSEWVASPVGDLLPDEAIVRGGTAWDAVYGQSCYSRHSHQPKWQNWRDDGFRCCREPLP